MENMTQEMKSQYRDNQVYDLEEKVAEIKETAEAGLKLDPTNEKLKKILNVAEQMI